MQLPVGVEYAQCTLDALDSVGTYHSDLQVYPIDILPPLPKAYRIGIDDMQCARMCLYVFGCPDAHMCPVGSVEVELVAKLSHTRIVDVGDFEKYSILGHTETLTESFIIYIHNSDNHMNHGPIPRDVYISKKMMVMVHDEELYRKGHFIVIIPPHFDLPYVWCIRDPLRADGLGIQIDEQQLVLLLRGANYILY